MSDGERLSALYLDLGWSLLPIKAGGKTPATRGWKAYQTRRASLDSVTSWLADGHGLGVVLGPVSGGLVCRDFDDEESYRQWAERYPELSKTLPTSKTPRGFHVFAVVADGTETKTRKYADGELRGEGAYVVLPPSIHPNGRPYSWLREPRSLSSMAADELGFSRSWSSVTEKTETTESIETTESTEMASVVSVFSVTTEEHERILDAIDDTVPLGVGQRNDGIFRFARKLLAILGGLPSNDLAESFGLLWYERAKATIATLDPMVTVADLRHAISRVRAPDDGVNFVDRAIARSEETAKPWFAMKYDDDTPGMALAKVVVELSLAAEGGVFFLSCRDAARSAGLEYRQANRLLTHWVEIGVLELVARGKPGKPGSKANRFRLRSKDEAEERWAAAGQKATLASVGAGAEDR